MNIDSAETIRNYQDKLYLSSKNLSEVTDIKINGSTSIYYRENTDDEGAIDQIFRQKQFDLESLETFATIKNLYEDVISKSKIPLIIDCGAHIGLASLRFSAMFPEAMIIGLEPNYDNYLIAKKNTGGIQRIKMLNMALSNNGNDVYVNDYNRGTMGYVAEQEMSSIKSVAIPSTTVTDIIRTNPECIAFLVKIDIEGAEKSVFTQSTEWLRNSIALVIELHDWLYPGKFVSEPFWDATKEIDYKIGIIGENFVLVPSENNEPSTSWKHINKILRLLYKSNNELFGWSIHLVRQEYDEKIKEQQEQLGQCEHTITRLQGDINKIYLSISWKLTSPFRYVMSAIRNRR